MFLFGAPKTNNLFVVKLDFVLLGRTEIIMLFISVTCSVKLMEINQVEAHLFITT